MGLINKQLYFAFVYLLLILQPHVYILVIVGWQKNY